MLVIGIGVQEQNKSSDNAYFIIVKIPVTIATALL
jgi:hypothetical protein